MHTFCALCVCVDTQFLANLEVSSSAYWTVARCARTREVGCWDASRDVSENRRGGCRNVPRALHRARGLVGCKQMIGPRS